MTDLPKQDAGQFFTLSRKEAIVLELLLKNPSAEMYGLELVSSSCGGLKKGTVYVTLSRMADKSYVESRQEENPQARGIPRRLYKATGCGRAVFEAWEMAQQAGRLHLAAAGGEA